MKGISRSRIVALASAVALGLASASARADVFAAICTQGPGSDIRILNATLGTPVALPSNVNTAAFEEHPSISRDGRLLVFRRVNYGTTIPLQTVVVDLVTGASATLFTGSENVVYGSTIRPEGSFVVTGRSFMSSFATVWISSLSAGFPRITKSTFVATGFDFRTSGRVVDVAVGDSGWIAMHVQASNLDQLLLVQRAVGTSTPLASPSYEYTQPALAENPQSVFFRQRRIFMLGGQKVPLPGDIASRPASLGAFAGTPTILPFNRADREESQPSITADGRYLAFVRDAASANDRLFVWDTQTQTLLNPNGVDMGQPFSSIRCGSTSIYTRPAFLSTAILSSGAVNATLTSASNIGIFVQRIVGKTKVLGRKTWKLETVGRVPLGSYGAGNVFTHWDFEVDGEPLPPGKYLVTLRAVEGDIVRELGEPQVIRIGKHHR